MVQMYLASQFRILAWFLYLHTHPYPVVVQFFTHAFTAGSPIASTDELWFICMVMIFRWF
jgi:hypothetical protein